MKNNIFISICFMIIIIIMNVPYKTIEGETIVIYSGGAIPSLVPFSIICFVSLTVIIGITVFYLKKPLQGNLIINRVDLNLKSELSSFVFWTIFVLTSMLLARDYLYFFNGTASYFFIILTCLLLYYLILKWLVRQYRPDFLSINNDQICLKSFFSRGNRKMVNLKLVSYDKKQNVILFSFQEGLDNFKLDLADYELKEVLAFIHKIKQSKGDEINFDKNFNKQFV